MEMDQHIDELIFETTDKHYNLFCKEVKYWIKKLNMRHYECYITHELLNGDRANIEFNYIDKIATISLSTIWYNVEPTLQRICKSAFHEVMELVLGTLYSIGLENNINDNVLTSEIHSIIRVLENTFFIDDYKKRTSKKRKSK